MKKELSKSKERGRRTVLWTKGHNGEAGVKGGLHCPVLLVREGPVVWGWAEGYCSGQVEDGPARRQCHPTGRQTPSNMAGPGSSFYPFTCRRSRGLCRVSEMFVEWLSEWFNSLILKGFQIRWEERRSRVQMVEIDPGQEQGHLFKLESSALNMLLRVEETLQCCGWSEWSYIQGIIKI